MKEKRLFDAITDLPDELVEQARDAKLRRAPDGWKKWAALAACLALIGVLWPLIPRRSGDTIASAGPILAVNYPGAYGYDDYDTRRAVYEANPVEESFLQVVNQFAYKTGSAMLSQGEGNANYSPLSLYYALAMAASGAQGATADELLALLDVSDQATLAGQSGNLYRRLYTDNAIGKLKIANSLWMDKGVSWKEDFVERAAQDFYAASFSEDFSDSRAAAEHMAQWISENTDGLLKPDIQIGQQQILSIINTIYFNDQWTDRFDSSATQEDIFHGVNEETIRCPFMNRAASFGSFSRGEDFTRAQLSLKNGGSMIFVLPEEGVSARSFLQTPEKLREAFEGGTPGSGQVTWKIPKFSFGSDFDVKKALETLGIKDAFEETANFQGITDEQAYISTIRQQTHIAIDEKGVEAAAYTEIGFAGTGMPEDSAEMILNRPFLFGITAQDGTLLFIGICENPVAQ
jgi:serine protease inhibitor